MPTYNKLVRDRIPEIIRQDGRTCEIETMGEKEYIVALQEKLVEQAQEAAKVDRDRLVTELADLYEVIDALRAAMDIDRETVAGMQAQRREERGGFRKRIRLVWAE